MADRMREEAAAVGPRCGNNPNVRLTPGDRQVVEEFKAYLARRKAGGPPERDPFSAAPVSDDAPCVATFREEPMPDTVYCSEKGYHQRHTAWQGSDYYAWLDGDEGAGWDR